MTWKSLIKIGPELYGDEGYEEWVERVIEEPWVLALEDLVKWEGVWVGTEEQLIQELKRRVGKEVRESEDFPSTFEQLLDYQAYAIHGFLYSGLGVFDYYQELADGDLEDFDVPGWGPEAPVLVKAGDAAYSLDFEDTLAELLKYWEPTPVALFLLTAGKDFVRSRERTYTTEELAKALNKHHPTYHKVPVFHLRWADPERNRGLRYPEYPGSWEMDMMRKPYGREGHLYFHKQIKKWAPILKEKARIKISWVKRRTYPDGTPDINNPELPLKTWWTIEAPRWKNADLWWIPRAYSDYDS